MTAALALYAALATVWALVATLRVRRWQLARRRAAAMIRNLARQPRPTPHQRAAETRARKRVEAMRRHRLDLERSMGTPAG